MTIDSSRTASDRAVLVAGVLLLVAPVLAVVVKFFSIGWGTFFILYVSPLLAIGFILQIVIAANGFLRAKGVVRTAAGRVRAVAAAWLTSVGVVLTAFFLVDGGDQTWGSTFMYLFGLASDVAAGDVSTTLSFVAGAAWLLGWLWLVVEWILALAQRRRARAVQRDA